MKTIFFVDDQYDFLEGMTEILKTNGYKLRTAKDFNEAKNALLQFQQLNNFPCLYMFDYRMKKGDNYTGLDVAKFMLSQKQLPSILFTVEKVTIEVERKASELGIRILSKELLISEDGIKKIMQIINEIIG